MKVQIVHIESCPHRTVAGERTRSALDALGHPDIPVEYLLVRSSEEAAAVAFAGSPTILIDGRDAFDSTGSTHDLACRVYATEQGLAGAPTQGAIEKAIRARLV